MTNINLGYFYSELAVQKTGSQDVQTVMDWMLSHEDELDNPPSLPPQLVEPNPVASVPEPSSTNTDDIITPETSTPVAKSIQCDDCGKLFNTNEEVEFHASKSGKKSFCYKTQVISLPHIHLTKNFSLYC